MGKLLLVGIGGFVGSVLRYVLSGAVQEWTQRDDFPVGTLAVNVLGCLCIGIVSQLSETRGAFTAETRTLLMVGLLGGFTTFSAFGNETLNLWRDGQNLLALVNVLAQLVLGLGAVWLGRTIAHLCWG